MARKRFYIFAVIICLVLLYVVVKAFDMMPTKDVNFNNNVEQQEEQVIEDNNQEERDNVSEEDADREIVENDERRDINERNRDAEGQKRSIDEQRINADAERERREREAIERRILEPVDERVGNNADYSLTKALELYKLGDYAKAEAEYKRILDASTGDSHITAECYDGMAKINAKNRKYGTAIIYAQKAQKIEDTPARRLLISKIYYKAGDKEKSAKMLNSVIESDF